MAKKRRQVPQERGVRGRDRDGQPLDELERCASTDIDHRLRRRGFAGTDSLGLSLRSSRHGIESGCRWADLDAGVPERDARVQVWTERQARIGQDVRLRPLFLTSMTDSLRLAKQSGSRLTDSRSQHRAAVNRPRQNRRWAGSKTAPSSWTIASSTSASSSASLIATGPSRSSRRTASLN